MMRTVSSTSSCRFAQMSATKAVDVLHDDEVAVALGSCARVEHLHDVRVLSRAAASASRRKRATKASSSARCSASSLTATGRSSTSSVARNTVDMPPAPMRRVAGSGRQPPGVLTSCRPWASWRLLRSWPGGVPPLPFPLPGSGVAPPAPPAASAGGRLRRRLGGGLGRRSSPGVVSVVVGGSVVVVSAAWSRRSSVGSCSSCRALLLGQRAQVVDAVLDRLARVAADRVGQPAARARARRGSVVS